MKMLNNQQDYNSKDAGMKRPSSYVRKIQHARTDARITRETLILRIFKGYRLKTLQKLKRVSVMV